MTVPKMTVAEVRTAPIDGDRVELSAEWGGERLYYRVPASRFTPRAVGDALVLSVLVPAMRVGASIRLPDDIPVSARLVASLAGIQRVWMSWNAALKKVTLEASQYDPRPAEGGTGLFYAGGVDSSYSLVSHFDDIDVLITAFGFDFTFSEDQMAVSVARNERFARNLGKEFVPIETNHSRFVFAHGVSRTFGFGATLASIAHLLGLGRCYIGSSHSAANMRPEGSHPVLDSRFSNGATEIVHDDVSVTRLKKTWRVAERPDFLENLRVCWEAPNENCGACSKCLRTMTALRLLGVDGPFPPLDDVRRLRTMAAATEVEYVVEMVLAAHAKGDDAVVRELKKGLRARDRKEALRHFDQAFFGGRLRALRRRFTDREVGLVKMNLRPDLDIR